MVIHALRRHLMSSAKVPLRSLPVSFSISKDVDRGWDKTLCNVCNKYIDSGNAIYMGESNPILKYEAWIYICHNCCSQGDIEHLEHAADIIIDLELTGINALMMLWGSFDNIPADLLL